MDKYELIENFRVSKGGKPHLKADWSFYESSWDMMHPVLEIIDDMNDDPKEMFMGTTWERQEEFDKVLNLPITSSLRVVTEKVVDFINWYNKKLEKHGH